MPGRKKHVKSKPRLHRTGTEERALPIPDPRSMDRVMSDIQRLLQQREFASIDEANAFMAQLMADGGIPPRVPDTPLERAQYLMYDAFEAQGRQRVQLARQALDICSDCADAYVLLAEEAAPSVREALALYQKGVEAGQRALGPEVFEEDVGHFWGITSTRPYMRARYGLAMCLWIMGEPDAAIEHAWDMLRLNPGDNQGVRYLLIDWLLQVGRSDELETLFEQYDGDTSVDYTYPRVLFAFRQQGDSSETRRLLKEALRWNAHVADFLLGCKHMPARLPDRITLGGEDEAVSYAQRGVSLWQAIPGALPWLAERLLRDGGVMP